MHFNGIKLSKIAIGLSQFNNNLYKKKKIIKSKNSIKKVIDYAIDNGINLFDTADNYGDTEKILGELSSSKKQKIIISTKAGFVKTGKRNFSQKYLNSQIMKSLKSLKLDCIDLFFINKPSSRDIEQNDLLEFVLKFKKRGLVKKFGLVIGNDYKIKKHLNSDAFDAFTFVYNLIDNKSYNLIKYAKKNQKTAIGRSPFNSGLLTNNFREDIIFDEKDFRHKYFSGKNFEIKKKRVQYEKEKFCIPDNKMLHAALSFVNKNNYLDTTFFGPSNKAQLEELVKLAKKKNFFKN
tara:strand:- start:62 stop:937 length:876 start_codon:yes stop_codon:yes gene_type:complete